MRSIQRIVLVEGSRLLRGILKRVIERDTKLRVVAQLDNREKIPDVIQHLDPDWIFMILPQKEAIPEIMERALRNHPGLQLMVMSIDSGRVSVRRTETNETSLSQKNLEEIIAILRENGHKTNMVKKLNQSHA